VTYTRVRQTKGDSGGCQLRSCPGLSANVWYASSTQEPPSIAQSFLCARSYDGEQPAMGLPAAYRLYPADLTCNVIDKLSLKCEHNEKGALPGRLNDYVQGAARS
jgi:hypothetical protein